MASECTALQRSAEMDFLKLSFNFLFSWYQSLPLCFNEIAPPAYQTSLIPSALSLQFPVAPNQDVLLNFASLLVYIEALKKNKKQKTPKGLYFSQPIDRAR